MKVLVCGGRDYRDTKQFCSVMDALHQESPISLIVHGDANGADTMAGCWAVKNGLQVSVYPANWNRYGRSAGPIRNRQMLDEEHPDLVVAFPGGKGTAHMVRIAKADGFKVIEVAKDAPQS